MSWLAGLCQRRLIVVTGKGGVGKTSIAAALGLLLSERGRSALVLEVDPRENVHRILDTAPSDGQVVTVRPGLYLQNLQPRQVVDQLIGERVKLGVLVRRILNSPIYTHFAEGAPGLKELAILGHALRLVEGETPSGPQVDVVILDAPATGHGMSMLRAPGLVSDVLQHGPVARLTTRVAELVGDPQACGIVVITLAEEMPVTEALELRSALETELGRAPELLVANALYPELPQGAAALEGLGAGLVEELGVELLTLWRQRRAINEAQLQRLRAAWSGPEAQVPHLSLSQGRDLTAELARSLSAASGEDAVP